MTDNGLVLIKVTIKELVMDFFMSAEIEAGVGDGVRSTREKIEPIMIELLKDVELESGLRSWFFIPIVLSGRFISDVPEVIKVNKKNKTLDCRLHIDYEAFKEADEYKQLVMMTDAIDRSIGLMDKVKVGQVDQDVLRGVLNKVRSKLLNLNG